MVAEAAILGGSVCYVGTCGGTTYWYAAWGLIPGNRNFFFVELRWALVLLRYLYLKLWFAAAAVLVAGSAAEQFKVLVQITY